MSWGSNPIFARHASGRGISRNNRSAARSLVFEIMEDRRLLSVTPTSQATIESLVQFGSQKISYDLIQAAAG